MQVLERYEVAKNKLSSIDYKSIKDWDVTDANGKTIGKIEDLIVDLKTGKIRYILGKTNTDLTVSQRQPHFILPVGLVTLRKEEEIVEVKRIDPEWISKCPIYKGEPIQPGFEMELARVFGIDKEIAEIYDHDNFRIPSGLCL
ncbi:MAG: PRC-barrel domain-containing protein [Sporocytophaga sp.]|uniref:PRC-barrel domain-containing protein n=1 Tax=Sporocytophaga sp. TaxID=2231183 RepID=UPI001B06CFA2|nr:PRC-barrel domain-containing protein [Sporocytophaga sp.]MBO9703079.1 PRC-barrel domain-containing protein [Sporocytophaga sp.]